MGAARFTLFGAAVGVLAHGLITFLVLFMAADAAESSAFWTGVVPWTAVGFVAYVAAVGFSYLRGRRLVALVIACCPFPALILAVALLGLFA